MATDKKGEGVYNVIAIGAGSAGLVTSAAIAGLGGRVALIEKSKMGGDCLNYGCVPSKALISSARLAQSIRNAESWGLDQQEPQFDFLKVFQSMRERRAKIEPNDSVERFEELGVDVFQGAAHFVSPHEVEVNGQRLKAKNFVITAGSRAATPDFPGMANVPYHTNETIFDKLETKPDSMIIIGGGPIGCELGQAMTRLGVKVQLVQRSPEILMREDPDVSQLIRNRLEGEGMIIHTDAQPQKVSHDKGRIFMEIQQGKAGTKTIEADVLLISAGRIPNVENLNLDAAGVKYNRKGIVTNQYLQSSQPHIWAAGDIAGGYQFTHVADYHARIVVANVMMPFSFLYKKVDYRVVPWATYVSPEVARVGLNETEAKQKNIPYDLFTQQVGHLDRAIVERADEGFIKVLAAKGSDRILGVTIVCEHGGDLLHEFVLAMKQNIGLGQIASTIHAYPTFAELARRMGDAYNKTRLSPRVAALFEWLFKRQRAK